MKDKWILIIGIPFVGIVMPLVFNQFSFSFLFSDGYRNVLLSVATTLAIWLGIRRLVIFLWDKYPWELHPAKHLLYEIIAVTVYTILIGFLNYYIAGQSGFIKEPGARNMVRSMAVTLLITYLITSLHEAWFFYQQWNISLVKAQALEKENIQSQYETLKSQINPHFLFNTLNTLTTLIEENPERAVIYVEKTADFLRNILSMKDKEVIPLEEEVKIINTFFVLQKERYADNITMSIDLPAEAMRKKIPPLTLQMLVENAIKHNIITSHNPLHINIKYIKQNKILVSNNLQKKKQQKHSSGIGLQNISNRFRFLSDKKMEITETENEYTILLPLLEM